MVAARAIIINPPKNVPVKSLARPKISVKMTAPRLARKFTKPNVVGSEAELTVRETSSNNAPKLRDANQTAANAKNRVMMGI